MSYKLLKNSKTTIEDLELISIRKKDMPLIKIWRNQQIQFLRQEKPLSDKDQEFYYNSIILPDFESKSPKQILLSYLKNKICIGYGGLVNISWPHQNAEISFLLDPQYLLPQTYSFLFSHFLTMIKEIAFKKLNLNRLYTETYDIREGHIKILEENGLLPEGRMKKHIKIDNQFVDSLIHGTLKEHYVTQ